MAYISKNPYVDLTKYRTGALKKKSTAIKISLLKTHALIINSVRIITISKVLPHMLTSDV